MKFLLAAAAACLLCAGGAQARDLPYGGMTATEIADWLRSKGLTAQVKPDQTTPGDQIVSSSADGINWDIYLYACDGSGDARRCKTIQYASGWSSPKDFSLTKVNEWDKQQRYARAYMDEKGNAWAEYDVDIFPGGTYEQLDHSLERWRSVVSTYKSKMIP